MRIDEPFARGKSDGTIRYYQSDALGSIIALTDEKGTTKTQYNYDPFGNSELIGETSDNPFQYTGRENDGTGLYYYRARYYSPELQRFISEDPIGLAGGINQLAYVANNPVNLIDLLGLRWYTGAGKITNQTNDVIAVTGDTRNGNEAVVFIRPGESYSFTNAWSNAIISAIKNGSMDEFNVRLVDPDFIHVPGEESPRKITPFPWDEIVVKETVR